MRKWLIIFLIVLLLGGVFYLLQADSYYSKQSRAEVIWRTLVYSAENQLAAARNVFIDEKEFLLDVPVLKQEYPVTCEVASLRMVLNYYGFSLSEDDLLADLRFDTTSPMADGVWGDPEKGFVGSVNGSIFDGTGYGVHAGPIKNLAKIYRPTVELKNPDILKIVGLVTSGKPVIVWGLLSSRNLVSWRTEGGKEIRVYPGEHARVVVGYTGEADDPDKLILLDPIYGKIRMSADQFARDWKMMDNRIVVLQ